MSHLIHFRYCTPKEGEELLFYCESRDKYRWSLNEINKKARAAPYVVWRTSVKEAPDGFTFKLPCPYDTSVYTNIVYLDPKSDAGLPHTRGQYTICLPGYMAWDPNFRTLHHEVIHLSQKQNLEKWWRWYNDHWQFEVLGSGPTVPAKWRMIQRQNPDTLDSPLVVWRKRYVPLTVFSTPSSPDLRICKRGFYDLKMNQFVWECPPGWVEMFGEGFNDEHPHEIAAHWIDGSAGKEKQEYFYLNPV